MQHISRGAVAVVGVSAGASCLQRRVGVLVKAALPQQER